MAGRELTPQELLEQIEVTLNITVGEFHALYSAVCDDQRHQVPDTEWHTQLTVVLDKLTEIGEKADIFEDVEDGERIEVI